MISFELSNGHPIGPHVPTTSEDDQYVEYPLDDLTGFPCNVEEEERVSQIIGFPSSTKKKNVHFRAMNLLL